MFGWLKKKVLSPINLWPASDSGIYIARFHKPLKDITKALSEHGYPNVCLHFNSRTNVVDFYTRNGTVAQVRVHGEMGCPCSAIVACNLSVTEEDLFRRFLPNLHIRFETLPVFF